MSFLHAFSRNVSVRIIFLLVLSSILLFIIYFPGASGPLIYDDFVVVAPLFERQQSELYAAGIMSPSGPLGRPISILSFLFNISLTGDDRISLKITNIIIHVINFILVYLLVAQLWKTVFPSLNRLMPLAVAMCWAFHPLHVSTVLYTVQRMTELSALFCLLGLYLYCRTRKQFERGNTLGIFAAFLICIPLAALSKENGLLLPLFYYLIEYFFYSKDLLLKNNRRLRMLFIVFLVIPAISASMYYTYHFDDKIVQHNLDYGLEYDQRLMTQARIVLHYAALFMVPDIGAMSFHYDDIVPSSDLFQPLTTVLSICVIALSCFCVCALRKHYALIAFGITFYLCAHLLESTLFPLHLMYEHRSYLPSLGLAIAMGGVFSKLLLRHRVLFPCIPVPLVLVSILLSVRVNAWSDSVSLAVNNYQARPTSDAARAHYAELLVQRGKFEMALKTLEESSSTGATIQALYIHCLIYRTLSDEQVLTIKPSLKIAETAYSVTGLMELSRLSLENQCHYNRQYFIHALEQFAAQRMSNIHWRVSLLIHKAYQLFQLKQYEAALQSLHAAQLMNPNSALPDFISVRWQLSLGNTKEALKHYHQAMEMSGHSNTDYSSVILEIQQALDSHGLSTEIDRN